MVSWSLYFENRERNAKDNLKKVRFFPNKSKKPKQTLAPENEKFKIGEVRQ